MELIGKPTINPFLFYSGKISGYIVWILLLLSVSGIIHIPESVNLSRDYLSFPLLVIGLVFSIAGLFNLGRSVRFGIPGTKTTFKTGGLYRVSRNPIYLGFDIITISSMIHMPHPVILLPGIYCMIVYHLIIIGEERFLEETFRDDYLTYKKKVRRYI